MNNIDSNFIDGDFSCSYLVVFKMLTLRSTDWNISFKQVSNNEALAMCILYKLTPLHFYSQQNNEMFPTFMVTSKIYLLHLPTCSLCDF